MSEMGRRGFLKGVFSGVAAGGIVIAAGIPDTQAFMEQVRIGDPVAAAVDPPLTQLAPGSYLYNQRDRIVAVVTSVHSTDAQVDVTMAGSISREYMIGDGRVEITALGI